MPDSVHRGIKDSKQVIILHLGAATHRRSAEDAKWLADEIYSFLCPECYGLIGGNKCLGCGFVFEYTREGE